MRNKVAESIFELQYIVAKWKSGKSGIFHKADDFDFLMSRGDPYYQFYKNAPIGWVKLKCLLAVLKGLFVVEQQVAFTVQHLQEIHFQLRNICQAFQIHLINTSR